MKVSLNWIREFTTVDLSQEELLNRINAQLGAVDEMVDLSEQYRGIYIVKVVSCEPHQNADKLKICLIDDGGKKADIERNDDGYVRVVCGAPNVAKGMLVAWIPPGATVPSTFADVEPLVLDKREIRGEVSNGMLASPKELEINDSHAGLLEIDVDATPGDNFAETYKLDDIVIDLENKMFTHRPDCFGILGVARELAGIQGIKFESPPWYKTDAEVLQGTGLTIQLDNQLPDLVPRITLIALDNITVKPSPIQMQSYLSRVGLKPINNVVDITNFIAHLTAQPMHAFDYDKVAARSSGDGASIVIRHPKKGESLTLLDGKTITPHENAILVCSDKEPLALAGIMGGGETEVDENTTRVLLEVANFDMYSVRRSSMKHGLFTEASTRFNKGQSAYQIQPVVAHAIDMFKQHADAKPASEFVDSNAALSTYKAPVVSVSSDYIVKRLGDVTHLNDTEITNLLNNVEFEISKGSELGIHVPFWRKDIESSEDIVEEVGRLYGYDKIPQTLPNRTLQPGAQEGLIPLKQRIRELLAMSGANELLTYSFVSKKLMQISGQDMDQAYEIRNALSPELNYYRMSIVPSLLETVNANHRAGHDVFALFEMNRVHNRTELDDAGELPIERDVLSFVFSSGKKAADAFGGAPYYEAKRYIETILEAGSIDPTYIRLDMYKKSRNAWFTNIAKLFVPHRSAVIMIGDQMLGVVGEFSSSLKIPLKVPTYAAGFEIDLNVLEPHMSEPPYHTQSRYPSVTLDVTYETKTDVEHLQMLNLLRDTLDESELTLFITPTDIFRPNASSVLRSTWHLRLSHPERTLTADDTQNVLKLLDASMNEHFSASRI